MKDKYFCIIAAILMFAAAAALSACGTSGPAVSGGWENVNGNLYKLCDSGNMIYSTSNGGLAVVANSPDC
jgi:hypothetical protein